MPKRIVILGGGESGAGAAVLAKKQGFDTFVSDMSVIKDKYKDMMDKYDIQWEEGKHTDTAKSAKTSATNFKNVFFIPNPPQRVTFVLILSQTDAIVNTHKIFSVIDQLVPDMDLLYECGVTPKRSLNVFEK